MKASFVSATLMMAAALAASPLAPATAADLEGDAYVPYDEPGYAEQGYDDAPPPRYSAAPRDSFGARSDAPGSIKDGYPVPVPPPDAVERGPARVERHSVERYSVERYEVRPPSHVGPRYACLEPWEIRRHLRRAGWRDIRPKGGDGRIVHIRARRFDSSSVFRLHVARCTGEVLAAKPYHLRSFAYGGPPWRY